MRTATTAASVLCVCRTCETHSSCPADTCVSATPAQTRCVTRPTTVPSAGCVRTAAPPPLFNNSVWKNSVNSDEPLFSSPAFRALLQIRAVRKKPGALSPVSFSPVLAQTMDHDEHSVGLVHVHVQKSSKMNVTEFNGCMYSLFLPVTQQTFHLCSTHLSASLCRALTRFLRDSNPSLYWRH